MWTNFDLFGSIALSFAIGLTLGIMILAIIIKKQ